ncbi:peptidylprolyl isomerase [Neolewinella persica]|uniref:peptidylprolyl isomerase n=1 Tax=Neolewinella persica TaxID=70998 RepID=UPI000360BBCA
MNLFRVATAALLLLTFARCSEPDTNADDPILARVHQKVLRLSELDGMFPPDATAEDSSLIKGAFVRRWSRETVLEWEAERNLPSDMNIDRLVRDYRASLVSSHYEEVLVSLRLDSTITQAELEAYYEESKGQYLLERPIVRCLFIRVPYPTQDEEQLQQLWNNGKITDSMALENYCERFAEVSLLDPTPWYSLDDIAKQLPEGTLTAANVNSKREFSQQDGSFRYYFRLLELKPRLEIAPLSYVEDQARKVILHSRKRQVIEEAREEIFERELRRNNIETF